MLTTGVLLWSKVEFMQWIIEAEDVDDLLSGNFVIVRPIVICENCTNREYSEKYDLSWCKGRLLPDSDFYCRDGKSKTQT